MRQTAEQFMRTSLLNRQPWGKHRNTIFAFYRPPFNKKFHLSMHIINTEEELKGHKEEMHKVLMISPKGVLSRLVEHTQTPQLNYEEIQRLKMIKNVEGLVFTY